PPPPVVYTLSLHDALPIWYRSLDEGRRGRLCCVMSHSGGYVLPALDRPAEALVLVREPVDRILSHHYFQRSHREARGRTLKPLEDRKSTRLNSSHVSISYA